MDHYDSDVVKRFVQFLYTGDYDKFPPEQIAPVKRVKAGTERKAEE